MGIAITINIDRRKTLGDLKKQLEGIVLVPAMEFKVAVWVGEFVVTGCDISTHGRSIVCTPTIRSMKYFVSRIPCRVCLMRHG